MNPIQQQWKNAQALSWSLTIGGILAVGLLTDYKHPLIQTVVWGSSWAASRLAIEQKRLSDRSAKIWLNYERWSDEQTLKAMCQKQPQKEEEPDVPIWEPSFYNWQEAASEAVGFIIAGNSGSAKTSLACWLAGTLTQVEPAQVFALDPHYNDIWQQQGIHSIGKIAEIESTIQKLLDELDQRCERKGKGEPLGKPLLIISDEIGACLERFSNPKWIISALKRLGSEGRKFGMTLIAINQSSSVDDLKISSSLRNNYCLILLGAAARARSQQMGKEAMEFLKGIAYPCVISGAVEDCFAVHPTHGSYTQFRKQGNPPQNLLPIRQLPLTFLDSNSEVLDGSTNNDSAVRPGSTAVRSTVEPNRDSDSVRWLNRCLEARFESNRFDGSRFDLLPLPPSEAHQRIVELRESGANQAQIILALWGVKKGNSSKYRQALTEYKQLIEE